MNAIIILARQMTVSNPNIFLSFLHLPLSSFIVTFFVLTCHCLHFVCIYHMRDSMISLCMHCPPVHAFPAHSKWQTQLNKYSCSRQNKVSLCRYQAVYIGKCLFVLFNWFILSKPICLSNSL